MAVDVITPRKTDFIERIRNLEREVRWLKARKQKGSGSFTVQEEVLDLTPHLYTGNGEVPGTAAPDGSHWEVIETPRLTAISFYQSGWQTYRHIFGEGVIRYWAGTDNFSVTEICKGIASFGDTANPFFLAQGDFGSVWGVGELSSPTKSGGLVQPYTPPYHQFWRCFTNVGQQAISLLDRVHRFSFYDDLSSYGQPRLGDMWLATEVGFPYYITLAGSGALGGVMPIHYPDPPGLPFANDHNSLPTAYMYGGGGNRYFRQMRPDVPMDAVSFTDTSPTTTLFYGRGTASCNVWIPYDAPVGSMAGIAFRLDEANDRAYVYRYRVYMSGGVKKVRKELIWTQHDVENVLWQDAQEWDMTPPAHVEGQPDIIAFTRFLSVGSFWTPSGGQVINLGKSDASPFSADVRIFRSASDTKPMSDTGCGPWNQSAGALGSDLMITQFTRGAPYNDSEPGQNPPVSFGYIPDGQAITLANLMFYGNQTSF